MITCFWAGPCMGGDSRNLVQNRPVTGTSAGDCWQQQSLTQSVLAKETQVAFLARGAKFGSKNPAAPATGWDP